MFRKIQPLLTGNATLSITMAAAPDDKIRLTITRVLPPDSKIAPDSPLAYLNEPIIVTGTADEMDVDLPEMLGRHVGQVVSLRTSFEQLESTLETARKEAEQRITDQKKRGQAPATKALPEVKPPAVSEPALF